MTVQSSLTDAREHILLYSRTLDRLIDHRQELTIRILALIEEESPSLSFYLAPDF